MGQDTLEECVSCMAIDNVSVNFITKNEFIRSAFRLKSMKLPLSPDRVMDLIHTDAANKRIVVIKVLSNIIDDGGRLGMIIDEWTSLRRRRYFNLTLTYENMSFNLGMVRIKGSFTSENCLKAVYAHLGRFSLKLKNHIVATINDGASVMVKYGKISGLRADDSSINYHESLKKARHIVKYIRDSSLRNDFFMQLSGRELKRDVKTRWNSSDDMLEALIESKTAVIATLEQWNATNKLDGIDWDELSVMKKVLKPLKMTVLALGRDDSDLEKAEKAVEFMLNKLEEIAMETKHDFAYTVYNNAKKRMQERENTEILRLLKCLRDPNECPQWQTLELARNLLKRLYPLPNADVDGTESAEETAALEELTMEDELKAAISSAGKEKKIRPSNYGAIEDEFLLFRANGKRTANLENLLNALLSIKPTSTAVERVFSASSGFVTKIRSRLSDQSIDDLVFLKFFYKSLTSRWIQKKTEK